jgi:hypothetical protein
VVHDVQHGPHGLKTLVVVHRLHGYTLLLRMLATALGPSRVRGFPAARTFTERNDEALAPLLGLAHDEGLALASRCPCVLCEFNRPDSAARVMVADAKECGEGVSVLACVSSTCATVGLFSCSARIARIAAPCRTSFCRSAGVTAAPCDFPPVSEW